MDGWIVRWMGGWMGGWMGWWREGWMDGLVGEWMDGWRDGWMDWWMDGTFDFCEAETVNTNRRRARCFKLIENLTLSRFRLWLKEFGAPASRVILPSMTFPSRPGATRPKVRLTTYFLYRDVPPVRVSFSRSSVCNFIFVSETGSSPQILYSFPPPSTTWFRVPSLRYVKRKLNVPFLLFWMR